jgi:MFS transporter, OPA family, glycerol-3-phosphate transporter
MPEPSAATPIRTSYSRWRRQIFIITWLAYVGFYLTRKSFAVAKIGLQADPRIAMSKPQMAWIDMANLGAYAVGQLIFGMAGDKAGPRKIVLAGMLGSVLAAVAMGASSSVILLGVLFFIQGLCQSTGWAPLSKNMSGFFSRRERGTIMGLWCTNYPVGGLLALLLAGYAGQFFGWRYAFYAPAAALLVIWMLFLFLQRNRPEDVGLPTIESHHGEPGAVLVEGESPQEDPEGSWKVIREVITNRMVLLLAFVYFLVKPARYAILAWGPKYVDERLHTGMAQSSVVSSMFELAGAPGALLAGYVSDRWLGSRRVPVCVICLLLLGGALFALNRVHPDRWLMGGCLFLIGFLLFGADSLIAGASAVDFGTKKGASTAAGAINALGSVGGMLGGSMPGFVSERWGWNGVFAALGAMPIVAALMLLPRWNALPASGKREEPELCEPSSSAQDAAAASRR